ncbi:MAG TPA: hypothetical protein VFX61_16285, partial [Micromonosporaceae bacterium]|nr:hypothetical protein [Micromonosporaceae bacterium]
AAHRLDPETGQCPICLVPGPCRPANVAANRLAELGLPLVDPADPHRLDRWAEAFRNMAARFLPPHRPLRVTRAPLLTFAWRWRLAQLTGAER